jgi:hypothetical protein
VGGLEYETNAVEHGEVLGIGGIWSVATANLLQIRAFSRNSITATSIT